MAWGGRTSRCRSLWGSLAEFRRGFEEGCRVEGAGGFVFVLEVDEDFLLFGERGKAGSEFVELGGRVAAIAAQAIRAEVGCGDVGCGEVVGFSDAESYVVDAQESVGFVGEPARVAELEGELEARFGLECAGFEEGGQAGEVGAEVGWKLEEQQAELSGGSCGLEGGDELGDGGVAFAQALEVGDALRGFEAETEAGGRRVEPELELGGRG